ncbi:Aldo/keto reductase [Fomes fomentarius]|nr:Aldo/keto reductase [Fomes fomentarius]
MCTMERQRLGTIDRVGKWWPLGPYIRRCAEGGRINQTSTCRPHAARTLTSGEMAPSEEKSALNVVMGTMTFGAAGKEGVRVSDLSKIGAFFDVFQAHGHYEVDTAWIYGGCTTEEYLGKLDWKKRGLVVHSKLMPTGANSTPALAQKIGVALVKHTPEDLRKFLDISLSALNTDSIDVWYLHGPDRSTPYEVTLKAVNELHKEGKFKRLGLSNYAAWEVAEIVQICKANGYVLPTVYQGSYNAVHRKVEPELFPALRKFGIAFYAYNPLGGGFFTGRYHSVEDKPEPGSRFDPARMMGVAFRRRYWNEAYFSALASIEQVAKKHELTLSEVALRWLSHHSLLKREHGDSVIVGASSLEHLEKNLADLEKGPLPEELLKVIDEAWPAVSPYAPSYFH